MLFLTFWLLFGQAKSNKACMADARLNENAMQNENEESDLNNEVPPSQGNIPVEENW